MRVIVSVMIKQDKYNMLIVCATGIGMRWICSRLFCRRSG